MSGYETTFTDHDEAAIAAPRALLINCTLKPSPQPSSGDVLGEQVLGALREHGVHGASLRAVDHRIMPGVEADMGEGDAWPEIREAVMQASILVFVTPTWLGQHSSVAQRVLERLDAEISETDEAGRPTMFGKVAVPVVVGNEDGAHHICGILAQSLSDVGFTIPAQASVYWNGRAMEGVDYRDLDETPEPVASAISTAAVNAAHLASLLQREPFPA
ncbi:flavodoxin family protein [Leucobacter sp. USHLN153]|uniref:flavodoxin family protein n=1 Tax=Leucobacter sp. USHLN153 TaxID=3081268 RepID=UPI00301631AD